MLTFDQGGILYHMHNWPHCTHASEREEKWTTLDLRKLLKFMLIFRFGESEDEDMWAYFVFLLVFWDQIDKEIQVDPAAISSSARLCLPAPQHATLPEAGPETPHAQRGGQNHGECSKKLNPIYSFLINPELHK